MVQSWLGGWCRTLLEWRMKMMLKHWGSCFSIKKLCSIQKDQSELNIVILYDHKLLANLAVWLLNIISLNHTFFSEYYTVAITNKMSCNQPAGYSQMQNRYFTTLHSQDRPKSFSLKRRSKDYWLKQQDLVLAVTVPQQQTFLLKKEGRSRGL